MHRNLVVLVLVFALLTMGCYLVPQSPEQPRPLTLPIKIYEREFGGHQATITLQPCTSLGGEYCFHVDARVAEGDTGFGVRIIQAPLPEGPPETVFGWPDVRDQEGSGGTWEKPASGAPREFTCEVPFAPGMADDYPVAVFVRLLIIENGNTVSSYQEGPIAVLQRLPDGKGVGWVPCNTTP